jgi:GT2 family glycosyltransferase
VSIAVVVLTFDRPHLLQRCLDNVLARTSDLTTEIVIVDNASSDDTAEVLGRFRDPRARIVRNRRNIGQSAYRSAFAQTAADHLIELDDDVVDAPEEWDRTLLDAFERLSSVGFLAANLVDDPNDATARIMYGPSAPAYRYEEQNGIRLKLGPVGGWCAITSRSIYDEVGGFRRSRHTFWLEDAAYIKAIRARGYEAAILDDLRVAHAGGGFFAPVSPAKTAYWRWFQRRNRLRRAAKRTLLAVPTMRALNARHNWFRAP